MFFVHVIFFFFSILFLFTRSEARPRPGVCFSCNPPGTLCGVMGGGDVGTVMRL